MSVVVGPQPVQAVPAVGHHAHAAERNRQATDAAIEELNSVLSGTSDSERILLKAAAGAGKSFCLMNMVEAALAHDGCVRVGIVAFANKQLYPLISDLGARLGSDEVCAWIARGRADDVPDSTRAAANVVHGSADLDGEAQVVILTAHMCMHQGYRLTSYLGSAHTPAKPFDVLFVDEAWQLPNYLYKPISRLAPLIVGVGDVGQLPPLDRGNNPYRGDGTYNPFRAWPNAFEGDAKTWSVELPAVWRPTAEQLGLWRSFYEDWDGLDCVAAPGDRCIEHSAIDGAAGEIWSLVASGTPTLVEVDGLPDAEAPDVDPPLLAAVEAWLDALLESDVTFHEQRYGNDGAPHAELSFGFHDAGGRTVIAVLATRNQAVEDAEEMVDRLTERHGLEAGVLRASTVDSWQGQTNVLTIAVHPLSGASELDEFNSAFGRLAVTCTRATHGLLLVARRGLDGMLADAPARPGMPFGEPGPRALPRQTHQRILSTFVRASVGVEA